MRESEEVLTLLSAALSGHDKSLGRLAEESGLTKNTVDKVRAGRAKDIHLSTFLALCEAVDILPAELFLPCGQDLSSDECRLLAAFRQLPSPEARDALLSFLKKFSKQ